MWWPDLSAGYKEARLEFLIPNDIDEALEFCSRHPEYTLLAGGTDICVQMNSGVLKPKGLISIGRIEDLAMVEEDGDFIEIGSLATHTNIINSKLIRKFLPVLAKACSMIGARQIQNRGTIGGNVMNASPAGDTLPVLLAYGAEVQTTSINGSRVIPFTSFYTAYRKTSLRPGEIIKSFRIKKPDKREMADFLKIGARKAQAISKVMGCTRILLDVGDDLPSIPRINFIAIAFGSVAPVPIRLKKTEKFLTGKMLTEDVIETAIQIAISEINPIDDIRSTAAYRRHVAGIALRRLLDSCSSRSQY